MHNSVTFLAADLGASSGRVMAGFWDGGRFGLEELHRFPNAGVFVADRLYWDVLHIWSEVQLGLAKSRAFKCDAPTSVGVDGWGIDFGLLDSAGRLIANPVHYRDARTEGLPEKVRRIVDDQVMFRETGVQPWRINTIYQLYSMVLANDRQLESAATLLTIPDLIANFLSGCRFAEYTEATTTQMVSIERGTWAESILRTLSIPTGILPEMVRPGTTVGNVRTDVLRNCGFQREVPVIAVASHDTAAAAAAIPYLDEETAFISSGTWSLMGTKSSQPNLLDEARQMGFTNEGSAFGGFLLLKNLTGLWIIQECLRYWEKKGEQYKWIDILELAKRARPFRSLLEPNEACFDFTHDMPASVCCYCARTGQPIPEKPGEFARSLFESLALKYRSVLRSLEKLTRKRLHIIRVVGGGSRNPMLCQMIADACNRPVMAGPAEATSLGNIAVQALATGHISGVSEAWATIAASYECGQYDPKCSDEWEEAQFRFSALELKT